MRLIGVVSSVRTGPLSIYTKTTHWRSVVNSSIRVLCVLLLGVVLAACGKKEPPANAKAVKTAKKKAPAKPKEPEPAILAAVGGDAAAVFKARVQPVTALQARQWRGCSRFNPKPRSFAQPGRLHHRRPHPKSDRGWRSAVGKSATANPDWPTTKRSLTGS